MLGIIDAPSAEAAGGRLSELGYIPISLTEERETKLALPDFFACFKKVKPDDLIMFSYQFATLIGAGIPILNGGTSPCLFPWSHHSFLRSCHISPVMGTHFNRQKIMPVFDI